MLYVMLGLVPPQLLSLIELLLLLVIILYPEQIRQAWAQAAFTSGELAGLSDLRWFGIRFFLDGVTGLLAITGALLLLVRKEHSGAWLGTGALMLSLTVNNQLIFYQDQFQALMFTLFQAGIYWLLMNYRSRYLENPADLPVMNRAAVA